jgi:hypothetical protein
MAPRDFVLFASGYGLARLIDNRLDDDFYPVLGSAILLVIGVVLAIRWIVGRLTAPARI